MPDLRGSPRPNAFGLYSHAFGTARFLAARGEFATLGRFDMGSSTGTFGAPADWIRAYNDAWGSHDPESVLGFMSDDVVYTDIALGERLEGTSAVRDYIAGMETNISSDYRMEWGQSVATDEAFATEWTMLGTHDRDDAERGLPATGQRFQISGVSIGRRRNGKVIEERNYWNMADFLTQLGLMPAPEEVDTPTG
jgi:steroid delta-isomerase-like uncharacterized protein